MAKLIDFRPRPAGFAARYFVAVLIQEGGGIFWTGIPCADWEDAEIELIEKIEELKNPDLLGMVQCNYNWYTGEVKE